MREQPRQIYTSVRSPDDTARTSPLVRAIVIAVLVVITVAVIAVAVLV